MVPLAALFRSSQNSNTAISLKCSTFYPRIPLGNQKLKEFSYAAFTLCNDLRDTIYYNSIAAGYGICKMAGVETILGGSISVQNAAALVFIRETLRYVAWNGYSKEGQAALGASATAGLALGIIDIVSISDVASFSADTIMAAGAITFLGNAYTLTRRGIGPKELPSMITGIAKLYKDKLWDYPRKIKPPRHRRPFGKLATAGMGGG